LNGVYDASAPATRSSTFTVDGHTLQRSALYTIDDGTHVYTCYLGGIPSILAREPVNGFGGTQTPTYYHTPMQGIYLALDTTTANAIYLADTRGGIHRVVFP
jgi:hypothetical protein